MEKVKIVLYSLLIIYTLIAIYGQIRGTFEIIIFTMLIIVLGILNYNIFKNKGKR